MDEQVAKVDELFAKWDKPDSPGCAIAIMREGRIIYERGYGLADLDHDVPVSPATIFHVASVSKQFTAAAIVLLAHEGKLALDDPVRAYVPEVGDFGVPLTIRHLIHHTSGLRDQWELLGLAGWRYSLDLITNDDVLAVLSRQKHLNFPPGSEFMYSNTGYTVLAEIVARVSDRSFRAFTSSRIFDPLQMKSTHFRDDHAEVVKDIAYGYVEQDGKYKLSITNFDTVGATSLLTSVRDLARWDENFYSGQVGGDALRAQMLECGKLNDGEALEYAFGLMRGSYRGLGTVHHGGADAGYRAVFVRFPEQKFSVACLSNLGNVDPGALARTVADIYLDGIFPQAAERKLEPVKISQTKLADRAGLYVHEAADDFLRMAFKDGKLRMILADGQGIELVPVTENHFRLGAFPVDLDFSEAMPECTATITVSMPLQKPRTYELAAPPDLRANDLLEYAGTYYSDEIENRYDVTVAAGKLMLSSIKLKAVPLWPAAGDLFGGWFGRLRFTRDARGLVSGIRFNSSRVRDFVFAKIEPSEAIIG